MHGANIKIWQIYFRYLTYNSYAPSPEDHFVIGAVHHARLHIDHPTAYSAFAFSSSLLYKFAISLAAEACNVTQQPL
jgi:hypothetical protein